MTCPEVDDVGSPSSIWRFRFESACEKVLCDGHFMSAVGSDHETFAFDCADLQSLHPSCDSFFAAGAAALFEFFVDARTSRGLFALFEDRLNLL